LQKYFNHFFSIVMKTIILLTDFSKNAAHAAKSAVLLAEQLHTGLLLWNCYPKVPLMPGYLGGAMAAQTLTGDKEIQDKLKRMTQQLEDFMTNTGGNYKPQLFTRYREGGFQEELAQQLREEVFEMIVIGAPNDCAIEHIFTGSHTSQVIDTANCPVLVVPRKAGLDQLDKVVFATDFEPEELKALHYLNDLSHALTLQIEIVHIIINGEKGQATIEKEIAFKARLATLKSEAISSKEIRGKEVVGRLNRISKQTGADVLAMTHHHYSFFKRLFSESITKKELAHQKIPLLVFPLNYKAS
jgi:nucleotide-binding universal stress UspA family protein